MEENAGSCLSKGGNNNNNMLQDHYKNVVKSSTSKAMMSYKKSAIESGEEISMSFGEFCSWPPKSYTCSFCKREFRSAQALGGHMNVHRREKAKLRQVNPHSQRYYLSFLHHQNPKPNVTTSTFPTVPFTYSCCLPLSDPACCRSHVLCLSKAEDRSRKSDDQEKEGVIVKKLATGLLVESKIDDLDLELRLGC